MADFISRAPQELTKILKEIIIVENGSTDGTLEACHNLARRFPSLVRVATRDRGSYGEAIKLGMLECKGTHLSILELDCLDSDFVMRSISTFRGEHVDLVVGSKRHAASVDRRPLKRRLLTTLYNAIFLQLLIGYPGTDTHGLKSIEVQSARRLCDAAITTDELFQTEIVLLAWRLKMSIAEIPITIREVRDTRVTVIRRVPKIVNSVRELKHSLSRFPR